MCFVDHLCFFFSEEEDREDRIEDRNRICFYSDALAILKWAICLLFIGL